MNFKIQEILQNQAKKNAKDTEVKIVSIPKPFALSASSPAIHVDDLSYFYTFDGRSLFFERGQTRPFISLPYETKMAFLLKHADDVLYAVFLSSKNKLEIVRYDEIGSGSKQVITRNVQQVVKTRNRVFYVFKKEEIYFINEVIYEGNKWIGKHVLPFIKAGSVELFASNDTILYAADGQVYNLFGQNLCVRGTFAYSHGDTVVVAGPGRGPKKPVDGGSLPGEGEDQQARGPEVLSGLGFEISLYTMDMLLVSTFFIETSFECRVRCAENIIVVQNENKLYILKTDYNQIRLADIRKQRNVVYQFDIAVDQNVLNVFMLTDPAMVATQESYRALVADLPCGSLEDTPPKQDGVRQSSQDGCLGLRPGEPATGYVGNDPDDGGISFAEDNADVNLFGSQVVFNEMETGFDAQVDDSGASTNSSPQKNYLFDAVRQSLGARKGHCGLAAVREGAKTSPANEGLLLHQTGIQKHEAPDGVLEGQGSTEKPVDRFERYARDHSPADGFNSAAKSGLQNDEMVGERVACRTGNPPKPEASQANPPKTRERQSGANISSAGPRKSILSDGLASEIQNVIYSSLESVIVKNEAFIKSLILKAIVPAVEATINEMRIQVITELKKIDTGSKLDPFYGRSASFKKLINSGKVGVAIQELVKLKGPEFEGILSTIHPGVIEGVDSNVLSAFVEKLFGSMKRQFKDHHAKLLYDALLDIEVSELSIDNLQSLSVAMRYSKEMGPLDDPGYVDLNFLIDIVCKKIKRRVNSLS